MFKRIDTFDLARSLKIDAFAVRLKHELIDMIVFHRNSNGIPQADLARELGVSQPYLARVESKTQTRMVSIDKLLSFVVRLGYGYRIEIGSQEEMVSHDR